MDQVAQTTARLGLPAGWAAYRPRRTDDGTLQVLRDRRAFAAIADDWDALVERCDDQLFHRHAFLNLWIEHFAPQAELRVLLQRDGGGQLVAGLPLLLRTSRLHGVAVRELVATANLHSCRFDLLADDPPAAARAFLRLLQQQADWDMLCLPDVVDGGRARALLDEAERSGLPSGQWASLQSPWIALPVSWDAMQARLGAKFRANLRRGRREL
jgi:hypothetical protein